MRRKVLLLGLKGAAEHLIGWVLHGTQHGAKRETEKDSGCEELSSPRQCQLTTCVSHSTAVQTH